MAQAAPEEVPDATHAHQKGIRGGLLHLLGADRMPPEIAAQLTDEQEARVRPGLAATLWNAVAHQAGPNQVQRYRAAQILGDQDASAARNKAAQDAAMRQEIFQRWSSEPNQNRRAEGIAADMLSAGLGDITDAAVRLRPRAPITLSPGAGLVDEYGNTITTQPFKDEPPQRPTVVRVPTTDASGRPITEFVDAVTGETLWSRPGPPLAPRTTQPQLTVREREQDATLSELLSLNERALTAVRATQGLDAEGKPIPGANATNISGRGLGVVPIPMWVRNNVLRERQGGEAGASARGMFGNLVSMVGKARSGGAITPSEFNRLETFLPTADDDEGAVMQKLQDFLAELRDIQRIRRETRAQGGQARTLTFEEWQALQPPAGEP